MTDRAREQTLQDAAIAALRRGDAAVARATLSEMADPPAMLLAQACNRLGDLDGEQAALNRILQQDMRNLPALLAMGQNFQRRGDLRGATSWFRSALAQAAAHGTPPALQPLLQRAQEAIAGASRDFEDHLDAAMAGLPTLPRIAQATDLLLGKTPLYLQQPSMFYFPGLPQRAFYERDEFAWVPAVEAATDAIIAELNDVRAGAPDFAPYVQTPTDRPAPNNPLRDDPSWGAYYFWQDGEIVADHAARCPAVMAALEQVPRPVIAGRSPMALWSLLKPGTHIQPHHGVLNTRLICHLPLIVADNCALRVGAETRAWAPGEMLIFDDSIEHEAWNRGNDTRVILLFEVWRPEIHAEERIALTRLFEAIDRFGPKQVDAG
ncbi:aspartyl/asparaginyl beta-hydroxylase domain-containing protein [Sphingobium yanoikuyae]|uniref:Aspartyl/asparaginyl beta-hydroxylase domain-containing protein n=1 Tax=Sphingobium yanoikuyae TaxID=13690 RepID=A0AA42WYD3_SPHYA|nr:aspartyl/asparaginyl beta-hydroxylase domain-containing protein [Sphingobium yanoikuyae]MDH2134079.1 aspartyl/asparaginyl beta-hydroxylase domain-containing protein [Sphingobium yanoikuyae]MDH2151445.1 aspartyl/asparaginyl beta-hydroxylase domain-containing protein [Sphingobium yanoikuyae]MDH2169245.1 aspartyl/asparaginyl beta-hydroxylase domain-containing protein [Sphingobium yanoikuyae]